MKASTEWITPVFAEIDDSVQYLVKTNGGEWRDVDLHLWVGYRVKHMLGENIIRGRPLLVARVIDPNRIVTRDPAMHVSQTITDREIADAIEATK